MTFGPELLAFTDGDVWRLGIGDPTVMGWLTVAGYFGAAILCFRQALALRPRPGEAGRLIFWGTLAGLLVLLGFNKQLDLQTLLTLTGRQLAIQQGWYDNRRMVQFGFIGMIALGGLIGFLFMWRLARAHGRELRLPLVGFVLLLCFVVGRAASFHHVDNLINLRIAGVRMNWVFELGAIAVIIAGAWKVPPRKPGELNPHRRIVPA